MCDDLTEHRSVQSQFAKNCFPSLSSTMLYFLLPLWQSSSASIAPTRPLLPPSGHTTSDPSSCLDSLHPRQTARSQKDAAFGAGSRRAHNQTNEGVNTTTGVGTLPPLSIAVVFWGTVLRAMIWASLCRMAPDQAQHGPWLWLLQPDPVVQRCCPEETHR